MDVRDLLLSAELSEEDARRFLWAAGFAHPDRADRGIQRIADLAGDRLRFAELAPRLLEQLGAAADPDAAIVQLERFYETVSSPLNLTSFLLEDEAAAELLIGVLGASPYLSQILLRNPECLYWLRSGNRIEKRPPEGYFLAEASHALAFERTETALDSLRRLRRRESLRIAAQDLLGISDLRSTVEQISDLADAVLQTVFRLLYQEPDGKGFAVFGMGKLGGRELNFSSDVDLIYVYDDGRDAAKMVRFARAYTRALSEFTGEGSLYRVDLRLRPMGRGGEIAYPLGAFGRYYETGGDTFDRLALIKCRQAAGDEDLGRRFFELVEDFVFRKYLDEAAVEEIRWLKKRTDAKVAKRGESGRDVKLGLGGIREIEFFVQAFQILYGGRRPEIRTPNTLRGLDRLVDAGFIGPGDYRKLRGAYVFFRNLEHRLQLVHDQQTQTLPRAHPELERVARRMGFAGDSGLARFRRELAERSGQVRKIFSSLFANGGKGGVRDLVLNPAIDAQEAHRLLSRLGAVNEDAVYRGLRQLQDAPAFPHSPTRLRNLLANLLPGLLDQVKPLSDPQPFFARFDRFCEALGLRAELYLELIENPDFADRLYRVFLSGDFLSETLIRHPELVDVVSLPPPPKKRPPRRIDRKDATERLDALRRFKRREEFKIALRDLDGFQDAATRSDLTALADGCLEVVCRNILDGLPELRDQSFSLWALGKLGGRELTYHSDLDLILIYREEEKAQASLFDDLARRLKAELERYTGSGSLYQVDFRLRPEGRRSALATPLSAFKSYLRDRIEPWERMAYAKLRRALSIGEEFDVLSLLPQTPFTGDDLAALRHVRSRKEREIGAQPGAWNFKVGRGGLMDIQFIVQRLQIEHELMETNTLSALKNLASRHLIDQEVAASLEENLRFLIRLEAAVRLLAERSLNAISFKAEENLLTARFLGFEDGAELLDRCRRAADSTRTIYEREFDGLEVA